MRGKDIFIHAEIIEHRITPAYAGKSTSAIVGTMVKGGSPPRMRGNVTQVRVYLAVVGITPAYAGKRKRKSVFCSLSRDHPRVCGEKHGPVHSMKRYMGITPAYAGKSSGQPRRQPWRKDHPRVCGEKNMGSHTPSSSLGSPPRMRGKVADGLLAGACPGITPAYAGKRLKRSRSTVPPVAIVPLFPSVCNKPVVSDGSPAGRDAPLFLPAENAVPASPAYNLRSL